MFKVIDETGQTVAGQANLMSDKQGKVIAKNLARERIVLWRHKRQLAIFLMKRQAQALRLPKTTKANQPLWYLKHLLLITRCCQAGEN